MKSNHFAFQCILLSLTTLSKLRVKIAISHNLTTSYNPSPIVGTRVFPTRCGEDLISPKNPQNFNFFKDWVDQNVLQKVAKITEKKQKNSTPAILISHLIFFFWANFCTKTNNKNKKEYTVTYFLFKIKNLQNFVIVKFFFG
jgi:hypothetical protein